MSLLKEQQSDINGSEKEAPGERPLVSLIVSAYNEADILEKNVSRLVDYLEDLEDRYDWEILIVNDGSSDNTGALGELVAQANSKVKIFHHKKNQGLGKGLQTGIEHSTGDYVITFDIDLSISVDHISRLLEKIRETGAEVVIASPTLEGGKLSGMPRHRRILSIWANKFLSMIAPSKVSNLTCMARVYKGEFIRSLNLRSMGMEIMPEILYKTTIMQGSIEEIPAALVWENAGGKGVRSSKMRIFKHTLATLFTGFLLRPFLFLIFPGMLLFLFSLYPTTWMFIHFFSKYGTAPGDTILERSSRAIETAYQLHPHTFIVSFFSLLFSIQLLAIGFQSLQNKHYFEEIYYLATKWKRRS